MSWPHGRGDWPAGWGEPPPVILNRMQVQAIAALFRGDPIISMRAGWGSGKTSSLVFAMKTISWLVPGGASIIVTDTHARYDRVLHPEISKWCGPLGWTWVERKAVWTDPNTGSTFFVVWYYRPGTVASTENPLEGINATSGFALVDECQVLKPEVAEKLTGRIRSGPRPIRMFVGLPVANAWWEDLAVRRGIAPILAPSDVNAANLGAGWLEDAAQTLSEEEYESMVKNRPVTPAGTVYDEWAWQEWPEGNLAPSWWTYKPTMTGRITIDPGVRKPAVLIIVHDTDPRWGPDGAHIVVAEVNLRRLSTQELIQAILEVAWPRSQKRLAPKADLDQLVWLDEGVIDRAGRQAREHDLRTTADDLELPVHLVDGVHAGGIGVQLWSTTDADRVKVPAGIKRVKRLMQHRGQRHLLCTREVYEAGVKAGKTRNSLQRAIAEYCYPKGSDSSSEEPKKSGIEDPLDALRYYVMRYAWYEGPGDLPPRQVIVEPASASPIVRPPTGLWRPGRR